MVWATVACFTCLVLVWSQGDPLGQHGRFDPALPLLFFLAALSALSTFVSALFVVVFGVLASCWRAPVENGTGLSR